MYDLNNVLMHIGRGHDDNPPGRGSGRYPFGSGERPYQGIDLTRTEEKDAKISGLSIIEAKEAKAKRDEEKRKKEIENLVRNAKASEVLEYEQKLTLEELTKALTRINLQTKLEEYAKNEQTSVWEKTDDFFSKLGKINNYYKTGTATYRNIMEIYNYLNTLNKIRLEQERLKKKEEKGHRPLSKTSNPNELSDWMKSNVKYSEFTKLKSAEEVYKTKTGSCHDQVMFEMEEFKRMGLFPKAKFIIEYDPQTNQGGTTHSFVYYEKEGKTYWFENAWGGQKGIHEYNSVSDMEKDVIKKFKENSEYSGIEMTDFGFHKSGESLQELVDEALSIE